MTILKKQINSVKMFEKVYQKIKNNKELKESGKQLSITSPFPRLSQIYPGYEKGRYYIYTANSGIKLYKPVP